MEKNGLLPGRRVGSVLRSPPLLFRLAIAWSQPLAAGRVSLVFCNAKTCCASVWTSPSKIRHTLTRRAEERLCAGGESALVFAIYFDRCQLPTSGR
jgi:hypothetical protein